MRITGASGFGDSIYLRAVAEHLGKNHVYLTNYPEIFDGFSVERFSKRADLNVSYVPFKGRPETTQWNDTCDAAGMSRGAEFSFPWTVKNHDLVESLKARGRILYVHLPRPPMNNHTGRTMDLVPDYNVMQKCIDWLRGRGFVAVQIGKGDRLFNLDIDIDLSDQTSVSDVVDIASVSTAFIGQCSFMTPLSEVFNGPSLTVFARSGLNSANPFFSQITPAKVLSKPTSIHIVDDWDNGSIYSSLEGLCSLTERK